MACDYVKQFPVAMYFVLATEFFREFAAYGFVGVFILYMTSSLGFSEDTATMVFHSTQAFSILTCFFGAFLADSLLGRFKTMVFAYLLYAIGYCMFTVASAAKSINGIMDAIIPLSMGAALVKIIAGGGITPNFTPFGGDQFSEEQKHLRSTYFMAYYFMINTGSSLGLFITPRLRAVKCLDEATCFPLAYGVSTILTALCTTIFLAGSYWYVKPKPAGNVVLMVVRCISHGISQKCKLHKEVKKDHWLDYADDKYDPTLIEDIKAFLHILVLYMPVPFYWALSEQQNSRWIFQAIRMDGSMFNDSFVLLPDQMEVFNPVLIMILRPIYNYVIYPLLHECHLLRTSLKRMGFGMLLACLAFVASAVLEMKLEPERDVELQDNQAQLHLINAINCSVEFSTDMPGYKQFSVSSRETWSGVLECSGNCEYSVKMNGNCTNPAEWEGKIKLEKKSTSVFTIGQNLSLGGPEVFENCRRSATGNIKIGFLYDFGDEDNREVTLDDGYDNKLTVKLPGNRNSTDFYETHYNANYKLSIDGNDIEQNVKLQRGGVYLVSLSKDGDAYNAQLNMITQFNTIFILWQLPQIVILVNAEILFSVTGLEFSYSQAPAQMKSVIFALWISTTSIGSLFIVAITGMAMFSSMVHELLLYAGVMFVDTLIFIVIACRFRYLPGTEIEIREATSGIIRGKART